MQNKDCSKITIDKEYQNELLLEIISSYICEKEINVDFSVVDWRYISFLAMEQGLGCFLYKAIEKRSDVETESKKKLEYYYQKAFFMCAARNDLLLKISSAFEKNQIDFLILKGAVIQGYYPSPELRVMSDLDFLVKKEQRKSATNVLESLNIKFQEANSYQDIFKDCNGVLVELHHALWGYDLEETELYSNIWNKKNLLKGLNHTYLLTDEDLYIFTIAHMLKHFKNSGIGIRPIIDIWYLLKKNISTLDFSYIKKELEKFNAKEFEKSIRALVNSIFLGKEKSKESKIIEKYLFKCKTHGTDEISFINQSGDGSRMSNIISRIFPPLSFMKRRYDVLEKLPLLLPFFWVIRIICFPFKKDRLSMNVKRFKSVNKDEKLFIDEVFLAAGIKKKRVNKIGYGIAASILIFSISIFCFIFFQNESIFHHDDSLVSDLSSENLSKEESIEQINDYGTISWKGGIYTGYLINNIPNGSGEHVVENSIRYVGVFSNGKYDGLGKIEYSDGSYYEGMFKNNQLNGEGVLYCANGDIINGTFTNGQPGGFCDYEYSDGNLFSGTMINGLKHGEGTFQWLNGDKYVGSFVDDKRDGYGVLTYANGDSYTGNWSQGFCSGYGVYVWKDGKKYEGKFENSIMNDTECKITYPDGSIYIGEISDGLQNGNGTLTYSNGDIAKGSFSSGELSGQADYYFSSKNLWVKVIYEKGEIIKYIID